MDKVVARMRCTGREERLEDCKLERNEDTPGKFACSRAQSVAGIICETSKFVCLFVCLGFNAYFDSYFDHISMVGPTYRLSMITSQ